MIKRTLPLLLAAAAICSSCAPRYTAPGIDPAPRTGFFGRRMQERLKAEKADVAVIFIGGFGEWVLTHIRQVYETMPVLPAKGRQVRAFYTWHGGRGILNGFSTKLIREDIRKFLAVNPNASIILIGHSYGGSAVMDVVRRLDAPIQGRCIAVTIDPVSRRDPSQPRKRAEGVDYWINTYCEPYRTMRDGVAAIGGPWRNCPEADVNIVFDSNDRDKNGHRYQHAEAEPMFVDAPPGEPYSAYQLLEQACIRLLPQEGPPFPVPSPPFTARSSPLTPPTK